MSDVDPQSQQPRPPEESSTNEPEAVAFQAAFPGKPPAYPPKNIFVCCDGTGNEFAGKDSPNSNSNVVKLYTALQLDARQVAYYHPGVGTMGDPTKSGLAREWSVLKGLAFGKGFEENVLDAYRYLMQHYGHGDKVYVIGFSRGAYTARALCGLLHGYGLLCRGNEGHIPYAWRMYTERVATQSQRNAHTIQPDTSFRDTFSHPDFSIHFVGLWDTVSSVGWINEPLRLLDLAQNPTIQRGRHAVSIDERRCFYQDNLWGPPVPVNIPPGLTPAEAAAFPQQQDLLQVWFCGVHSDIGGSYPQLQSGLSNITLEWMIQETADAGAVFDPARVRTVLGTPGPGEPTPQDASLAPLYEKPSSSPIHHSLHGVWWLLEFLPHRYYDKDDSTAKRRIPLGAWRKIPKGALIHPSVKDRFAHPCYKPGNIALDDLVDAPPDVPHKNVAYLLFDPKRCSRQTLRQNWFLVVAVAVIQLGLAFDAASLAVRFVYQHLDLRSFLAWLCHIYSAVETAVMSRFFVHLTKSRDFVWAMLLATVFVLGGRLVTALRKLRT